MFIKSLGNNPLSNFVFDNPILSVSLILIAFVLFSLVLGYLGSNFEFREEEIRNHSKSNPVLMDIQKSIGELSAKLAMNTPVESDNQSELSRQKMWAWQLTLRSGCPKPQC
ncbi:hypothetical protein ACL7TT_05120 [Microbulbifer sp. 2304DJ12-6]|uniref:hypothetical protein n=1 Tax=Microbulbifer sp. 2304DJ12-6 TaxID=3233340 RepID=UPI0039B05F48